MWLWGCLLHEVPQISIKTQSKEKDTSQNEDAKDFLPLFLFSDGIDEEQARNAKGRKKKEKCNFNGGRNIIKHRQHLSYLKCSGCRPDQPVSGMVVRRKTSSRERSKSKISRFSFIRAGAEDLGRGSTLLCRQNRRQI